MKKTVSGTLVAGAMTMALILGGCGGQQQPATKSAEPAKQEQTATTETTKTNETTAPTEQTTNTTTNTSTSTSTSTQQAGQISEEEAKNIALTDAGVSEADVTQLTVHLDTDDGVTKYEVDFNVGQTEYDYDIDATTGAILERSSEIDD